MNSRTLFPMTAAHGYDDLSHLADRLSPRPAERPPVLVASDPELAPAAGQKTQAPPRGSC